FTRSGAFGVGKAISGAGAVTKRGANATALGGGNTYTGATAVSAGTLAYGSATAVPAGSVVTVASGATLGLNGQAATRSANTTIQGTLDLGTAGTPSLDLTAGTHTVADITGTGTVIVRAGATLTLTGRVSNAGLTIVLSGGTLNLGNFSHDLGAIQVTANSTVDFSSSGNAQLNVDQLTIGAAANLAVTNWTAGTDHFLATAINGSPATNTANVAPLNRITLGANPATSTYWTNDTPGELLATGPLTYWDITAGNGTVDGGTGTWDATTPNWTNSTGAANGVWAGGTNTATFQGTAGTVTVSGTQSIGGLNFIT
ncbi:autotransporter-associated beta strand repeat-containing protein, partial [Nostoc sp. NIES-2111]